MDVVVPDAQVNALFLGKEHAFPRFEQVDGVDAAGQHFHDFGDLVVAQDREVVDDDAFADPYEPLHQIAAVHGQVVAFQIVQMRGHAHERIDDAGTVVPPQQFFQARGRDAPRSFVQFDHACAFTI